MPDRMISPMSDYKKYKEIVYEIIGAAMKVHSEMISGKLRSKEKGTLGLRTLTNVLCSTKIWNYCVRKLNLTMTITHTRMSKKIIHEKIHG